MNKLIQLANIQLANIKHKDLIDQKAARPELIVEWRRANYGDWTTCPTDLLFLLNEDIKYRLVEPTKV